MRNYKVFLVIGVLSLAAILERVWFDLGPNIELITLATMLAGIYFGIRAGIITAFVSVIVSDLIIGNSNILIFTWTGFLVPILFIYYFNRVKKSNLINRMGFGVGGGLLSNLIFYIWTNYGVWYLDSWGMYSDDFSGLLMSYINGLPFLKMQIVSNLLILPSVFLLVEIFILISKEYKARFDLQEALE